MASTSFRPNLNKNTMYKSLLTLFIAGIAWLMLTHGSTTPRDINYASGYTLYAISLALILFNMRKKLAFVALGRMAHWMQAHIYIGWLAVFIFFSHTNWQLPHGYLDWALYVFSVGTLLTGIVGLVLNKLIPLRLQHIGPYQNPNTIQRDRHILKAELEAALGALSPIVPNSTLQQWYDAELKTWMGHMSDSTHHIFGLTKRQRYLSAKLDACARLLLSAPSRTSSSKESSPEETQRLNINAQIEALIDRIQSAIFQKVTLDQKQSLFSLLRTWLFLHIPIAYGMIMLATIHFIVMTVLFEMGA